MLTLLCLEVTPMFGTKSDLIRTEGRGAKFATGSANKYNREHEEPHSCFKDLPLALQGELKLAVLPIEDFPFTERHSLHAWRTAWTWLSREGGNCNHAVLFSHSYQLALPGGVLPAPRGQAEGSEGSYRL